MKKRNHQPKPNQLKFPAANQTQGSETIDESPDLALGLARSQRRSIWRYVIGTGLFAILVAGGTCVWVYRSIQTYRYYDWTIVPASDNRIEAVCGELTLYYMGWQDHRSDKPVGVYPAVAAPEQCLEFAKSPTPVDRFSGLKDPDVLAKLRCQPDVVDPNAIAYAWNCEEPVGKLLKAELEQSSSASSVASPSP